MFTRYLSFLNLRIPHHCHISPASHLRHLDNSRFLWGISHLGEKKSLRNGKATHPREAATKDWWLELRSLKSQAKCPNHQTVCLFRDFSARKCFMQIYTKKQHCRAETEKLMRQVCNLIIYSSVTTYSHQSGSISTSNSTRTTRPEVCTACTYMLREDHSQASSM